MADNQQDPWEQRPDESPQAWEAFRTYRDMGPKRSTAKVASELSKSKTLMDRWSARHHWVQRAEAWDREDDRAFAIEQREARKSVARRHARLAQGAQAKFVAALQGLDPTKLKPLEIIRLLEVTTRVEREALGITSDGVAATSVPGVPEGSLAHVPLLTDEDRQARLLVLRREIDSRLGERQEELDVTESLRARAVTTDV